MKAINKILKLLAIIALFVFGMSSCQDATLMPYPEGEVRPPFSFKAYPLEVSNYWIYDIISHNNTVIDSYRMEIVNKYTAELADSTVEYFVYNEIYQNNIANSGTNGSIYFNKNQLISTLSTKSNTDKMQQVVLADYPLDIGKEWRTELFGNLPGMKSIIELREVTRNLDTAFSYFYFRNCAEISRKWVYNNGIQRDTVYIGKYVLAPQVGLIYEETSINNIVYEKKILRDYALRIRK